jgi:predicted  nucleic acid-binding Zn-ribbon protein
MPICIKCGKEFSTNKCLNCKGKIFTIIKKEEYKRTPQNKNKINYNYQKSNNQNYTLDKDTIIKIIAIMVTIIALIMIKDKYEEYQAELAINAMIIQSNKAMKEANEQMKQTNDKYNQQMNDLRQSEIKMIQNAQNKFPMPEKIKLPN